MLTLAIIGAIVLTTTVAIFWNMPTHSVIARSTVRDDEAISSAEIAELAFQSRSQ